MPRLWSRAANATIKSMNTCTLADRCFPLSRSPTSAAGAAPYAAALGDVDDDGDLDIVAANVGSDNVAVLGKAGIAD
ncbi:MAG: hypothetical protein KME03_07050 [Aphanocapsa lilacina HA4352-LM1]|jgi:hypothetical protein|nr:hypothetical protein [Aphanocapsa lilacina HA4352-LM1]